MQSLDFVTKRGVTFDQVTFEISINSVPLDLTGATISMQIRKDFGAPVVYTPALSILDAVNGVLAIDEQIIDIAACVYKWDLRIQLASGKVHNWTGGNFTVKDVVTRTT